MVSVVSSFLYIIYVTIVHVSIYDINAKVKIKIDNMLTSVHFFTQFITIVVNIYGQTELKRPILLRGNNKKARLGMRGVLEGSAYC